MMSQCIQLIQPIYEFSSSEASGDQTEKSARATLSRLVKFIKTDSNIPQSFSPSPYLSDAFKELVELLELSDCKFLPEYGCCLISKDFSRFKTHSCNIILVSLDQWKRMVHSSTQNNLRSQSSIFLNQDVTSIGVLQSCDMPLFRETFRKILTKVAQNATNQSSPGNKHHKTPGQIIAVANCALSLDANKTPEAPEGGYTDVGLHTGGKLRSTAWPLVQALVSFLMKHVMQLRRFPPEETAALFVLFDLWNARDVIGTMAAAESITATYVDNIATVLRSCARRGATYKRSSVDWQTVLRSCKKEWQALELLVDAAAKRTVQLFSLPHANTIVDHYQCSKPRLVLPPPCSILDRLSSTLAAKKAEALCNLMAVPLLPQLCAASISDLSNWLADKLTRSSEQFELATNAVDHWLYVQAGSLSSHNPVSDASAVELLIERYRTALQRIQVSKLHSNGRLRTVHRSRELLATWICFCLVHRAAAAEHPLVLTRSVCLDWRRLRVLVLSDRKAIDAQLAVCAYLQAHTSLPSKPLLFSLTKEEETFEFALEFARADSGLLNLLAREQKDANDRVENHWRKVVAKRTAVENLNAKIRELNTEHAEVSATLLITPRQETYSAGSASKKRTNPEYTELSSQQEQLESDIAAKEAAIQLEEMAPASVIQPLPQDPSLALTFLFFLYMPRSLAVLARMGFMAQQMLLPRSFDDCPADEEVFRQKVKVPAFKSSLKDHFHKYSEQVADKLCAPKILLMTREALKIVSPSNINQCHDKSCGIWYPDLLKPHFAWNGGGFDPDSYEVNTQCWNPFGLTEESMKYVALELTERLSEARLQPFMPQLGFQSTASDRSNVGIAAPADNHYDWINKPISRAFTSMRAYPQKQLRNLVLALQDRTLPLNQLSVHGMLRQVLYQVGDISPAVGAQHPQLVWKTDFDPQRGTWLGKLTDVLCELADELVSAPKNHFSMRILAEIAAYAAQWSTEARDCARSLSMIAYNWATSISVTDATLSTCTADRRARQCLFYMYSLCAHAYGSLSMVDAAHICKLILLIQNLRTHERVSKYDAQIKELAAVQEHIMTRRIDELLPVIANHPDMLTIAATELLTDTPQDLLWNRLPGELACFEAVSTDGHLYSVNVISGVFLFDGKPLSRLPMSIRSHPLYRRSFEKSSFEIKLDAASGVMTTTRGVEGCYFSFQLLADNALSIIETDVFTGRRLRLLDTTTIGQWAPEFPPRLQEMHSHWVSEDGVVVFRPISFKKKTVSFVHRDGFCARIPDHLQHLPWWELTVDVVAPFDQLARLDNEESVVAKLLSKFEEPRFIHVFTTATEGLLNMHLPRFDLEFQINLTGEMYSSNFKGYSLSWVQQFEDTLLNFTEYLVLCCGVETKVLVPKETLLLCPKHKTSADQSRTFYVFTVHPRLRTLQSNSIAGRLYLAALYAASGSHLPESRTGMTGDETAMRLLRECWVNRPLSEEESRNLQLVAQHTARNPALLLLCHLLYTSSTQLDFLHEGDTESSPLISTDENNAAAEYMNNLTQRNWRSRLTPLEEESIFGFVCNLEDELELRDENMAESIRTQNYNPCDTVLHQRGDYVERVEQELLSLVKLSAHQPADHALAFPLETSALMGDKITKAFVDDLRDSFSAYQKLPVETIDESSLPLLSAFFSTKQAEAEANRRELERHVLTQLETVLPQDAAKQRFCMEKLANFTPSKLTSSDLLRIASEPQYLVAINPFFTAQTERAIRADIVLWLKLCVLEDKLERLVSNSAPDKWNSTALIQDLQCVRRWNADEHIEWLVFEVEGRLQIRPAQYTVAKAIIENKGAIVQLNMGEGKTRVILPMLILYWGKQRGDCVVRLHFLSQLLDDAFSHFHEYLCASALNRKIFVLPFNRDVEVTPECAELMLASLEFCRQSGGCVLVAPEHRLSLELKKHELQLCPEEYEATCVGIDAVVGLRYIDMLDESDEVLRHKYQLIYSVGDLCALPGGASRWVMVHNVFEALVSDSIVRAVLDRPDVIVRDATEALLQAFHPVRFVPGVCLANAEATLCQAIATSVFESHSYELQWLSLDSVRPLRHALLQFVTDSTFTEESLQCAVAMNPDLFTEKRMDDLLALRGLLAYRTLFTAMEKRHRVNYGVKRGSAGSKRVVVPFKASDTPSERSEFNHPDMAILLTTLSYYYDGLSRAEVLEAFEILLSLNRSAQEKIYAQWLQICAERSSLIDCIDKLDLANDEQVIVLQNHFARNRRTINFWLSACVLPQETQQYSHKLIANAWNIATNATGDCMGFAGTDDTSYLLPLQVARHHTADLTLCATNGLMLARLLGAKNARFSSLVVSATSTGSLTSNVNALQAALFDSVITGQFEALIDAGALCTGCSNVEVADNLLKRIDRSKFRGVVYFDNVIQKWCTKDVFGCVAPLSQSPLHERDCFVYFDESRCRGADMKLQPTARAMLTLGLKMCKDKLMQAVGRMRQFGRGQRVTLVAAQDVTQQIVALNRLPDVKEISMCHTLLWVLNNTVEATKAGIAEWAYQGLYYCTTHGNTELVRLEEQCGLRDYYTEAQTTKSVAAAVNTFNRFFFNRAGECVPNAHKLELAQELLQFVVAYGSDVPICGGTNEEEAEKQLEKEVEKEIEREVQLPNKTAVKETDWPYESVLFQIGASFDSVLLCLASTVYKLADAIEALCSPSLGLQALPWHLANAYCTQNYAHSIVERQCMEQYLRCTDVYLEFTTQANSPVLLLSDREANAVLALIVRHGEANLPFKVRHLSEMMRLAFRTMEHALSHAVGALEPDYQTFLLLLFEGETTFPKNSTVAVAMNAVLKGHLAAQCAALKIPAFRGKSHLLAMSDLEEACRESL